MTSISRWRDKRCPRHLDDMEKEFVERDPELHTAIQQHSDLVDECERNPDPALIPPVGLSLLTIPLIVAFAVSHIMAPPLLGQRT
jgi:uncharacterized protein DUF3435